MPRFTWLLLLLLGVAFLLRVDFIFYILYVVTGVYLWSRWYSLHVLEKLEASRRYRQRAFLGESVDVMLTLTNKSRLAVPWLQFQESVPPELRLQATTSRVVTLRGRETVHYSYQVKAMQRGYYQLGPLRITSGDLFGLARQRFGTLPADHLTVYRTCARTRAVPPAGRPDRVPRRPGRVIDIQRWRQAFDDVRHHGLAAKRHQPFVA